MLPTGTTAEVLPRDEDGGSLGGRVVQGKALAPYIRKKELSVARAFHPAEKPPRDDLVRIHVRAIQHGDLPAVRAKRFHGWRYTAERACGAKRLPYTEDLDANLPLTRGKGRAGYNGRAVSEKPKAIPKPRWWLNTYFHFAVVLAGVGVYGFFKGARAIFDPGQVFTPYLPWLYLLAALLFVINGYLIHQAALNEYRRKTESQSLEEISHA
jgi:hypothetical protein